MKCSIIYIFLFCFISGTSFAQNDTNRQEPHWKEAFLKHQVLPIGLITSGSLLNIGTIKYNIQNKIPDTNFHGDNYFQYAPIGQMYVYDFLGFEHQNSVFDQTKYLAASWISNSIIVTALKRITKVRRPNGGLHSFPSGHTTTAFMGATVLYHEFKNTEPLLAYSGYIFATATAFLRLTNNAHWLPDVLAGAGIAMLTTNLIYHFKPLKNFQPFKKNNKVSFIPVLNYGILGFQCRF